MLKINYYKYLAIEKNNFQLIDWFVNILQTALALHNINFDEVMRNES
jgi:hypothetical protein